MLEFLKQTMRPSSISTLMILLTPGVLMLYVPRLARWGRRWTAAAVALYWLLSSPLVVDAAATLFGRGYAPITSAAALQPQAIVMLGAGTFNARSAGGVLPVPTGESALRLLETARLSRQFGGALVIASGGVTDTDGVPISEAETYSRLLVQLGVSPARIVLESASKNTHDEAVVLKTMLKERGIERFVMVTSPLHMGRSVSTFRKQGLDPIPAVSALYFDASGRPFPLLPNDAALRVGDALIYETFARIYYWWRGWLA